MMTISKQCKSNIRPQTKSEDKMTRYEENENTANEMIKRSELKANGTYEEIVTLHLGVIAAMLIDMSKSFAIIADKLESEDK